MPWFKYRISTFLPALLTLATAASAATRTVELDGSGDYTVIQDALIASTAGDTVLVGPGLYTWANQGSGDQYGLVRYWQREQNQVALISTHGPESTILDAEGQGRVFFANGDNQTTNKVNFRVRGFTMRNGYAPKVLNRDEQEGGAIAMHECEAVIEDCIFENNEAEFGGAVWLGGVGQYEFRNCVFRQNSVRIQKSYVDYRALGGGVFVGGSPDLMLFANCTFVENHAEYRGGGIMIVRGNIELRDCLFAANSTGAGATRHGTAIYGFEPRFLRMNSVTVRDHDSAPGAAVLVLSGQGLEMNRTVVAGTVSGRTVHVETTSNIAIQCTNLHGGFPDDWLGPLGPFESINGNLQVDPLFCSESGDLTRVDSASPMLAENNSCGEDIGLVSGDCVGVPVLVAGLTVERVGDTARLSWEGVPPGSAGLRAERESAGSIVTLDLSAAVASRPAQWTMVDPSVPLTRSEYRLLDPDGRLLAEASLVAAVPVLRLLAATPNPFNPRTRVSFELAEAGPVRVDVFDSRGRRVATLLDEERGPGRHALTFEGRDSAGRELGSGVYHLRLSSRDQVRTRSLVLLR